MTTTPRIIVAIGGPKAEHPAIDWALDYAPTAGAEVELLHVVDLSWRTNPAPFAEAALLAAEEELRDLAALYSQRSGQVVHSSIALGRPVEQIVERAEHAELVVLGTHHDRHLDRAMLNTIAARIAGRISVSAVVVPHSTVPGTGIVVGVDDSITSAAPLAFAAREADRLGEPLTVVHSWNAPRPWTDHEIPNWPAVEEDEERRMLAECVAGLAQSYPDLPVRSEVVFGRASEVLYNLGRGARMLVVGSHGRQGFEKAWLGSTSEDLVLATPTTIAVIR